MGSAQRAFAGRTPPSLLAFFPLPSSFGKTRRRGRKRERGVGIKKGLSEGEEKRAVQG